MKNRILLLSLTIFSLMILISPEYSFAQAALLEEPQAEQKESDQVEEAVQESEAVPAEMPVEKGTKVTRRARRSYTKRSRSLLAAFSPVVGSVSASVVEITDGKKRIALGTVIDAAEGLILTKASELRGDLTCEFSDGSKVKPTVFGVDPVTDLVLLKVEKEGTSEVVFEENVAPEVGSWLATVNQKSVPLAVGIVSHDPRLIKSRLPNSAIVGIQPENRIDGNGVRINFVFNDSPAEEAGLLVNDIITAIDGETIEDREQLMEKLSQYHPGDEIVLQILRDDEESDFHVTLGKRRVNPMMQDRSTQQNSMGSTLSKRRSDFPLALQHDSALNANDCGGPIVDISGRIVGINIARDGRVSSLALPNEIVIPVIAKLRSGNMLPQVVNKKEIVVAEKELAQIELDLKELPGDKMDKELEFSAGSAVADELQRQIEDAKKRLKELQARLEKKKELNSEIGKSLSALKSRQSRLQGELKPLKSKLKKLRTGVE